MELQNRKIVILGAGHVGSHAGYSLIAQGLAEEIVYIDIDQRKAEAQALDLFDATNYLPSRAKVRAGTYADAKDAQLLIVAVGPLPDMSKGQTRMDTLHQTIPILKDVHPYLRLFGHHPEHFQPGGRDGPLHPEPIKLAVPENSLHQHDLRLRPPAAGHRRGYRGRSEIHLRLRLG